MPKPITEEEFNEISALMAPAVAKFWKIPTSEAQQGQREAWNAIRIASEDTYDGTASDWAIGTGCRANGASPAEREAWGQGVVRLWRGRAG